MTQTRRQLTRAAPLLVLGWLMIALPAFSADTVPSGVAFHIDSDEHMNRALRQISRHLEAHPSVPIRVILIANGVNPSLDGATDPNGGLYSAQMEQLLAQGVRIFACENTLSSFNKTPDDLTFGIETVPSGIAELGRLQFELGFAYIKL